MKNSKNFKEESYERINLEEEILRAFLYNDRLKFSDIEKSLNKIQRVRSNKLAYHLKSLVKKNVLKKIPGSDSDLYQLTETSETLIPYLSDKKSPLPVVLIALGKNSNNVFLYKRYKRPFKNKLSLPGGRILQGESIDDCVKRIMKEKHKINAGLEEVKSVSLEHVTKQKDKQNNRIHSFFLIFVTASTSDKIDYINLLKNKNRIIESDYNLVKKYFNNSADRVIMKEFFTQG